MTLNEALAASPTGIAIRHHNKTFTMAAVKSRHAFLYSTTSVAEASWPTVKDDWMVLKAGPTSARIEQEIARCGLSSKSN